MRLIVARCEVQYSGRLVTCLPMAVRLIMLKADGGLSIWHDGGSSVKPQNWMSPPTVVEEDGSPPSRIVVRQAPTGRARGSGAGASEDRLEIEIAEVLSDVSHDMGEAAALEKDGVERD